jgi:hypothetical protein
VGDRDVWATPEQLKRYARAFRVESAQADPRLLRFINLVFGAFEREIAMLQDEKARAVEAYRAAHGDVDPFENRSLEILSRVEINVRTAMSHPVPDGGESTNLSASPWISTSGHALQAGHSDTLRLSMLFTASPSRARGARCEGKLRPRPVARSAKT